MLACVLIFLWTALPAAGLDRASFARLSADFSEPDGYFDTDNLISNETTFLDVAATLRQQRGGVYIGVGPDQNFSYIALARPEMAFMVDIRRGNLLLHLLFRAIFEQASNRMEYLCLLLGRKAPADLAEWDRSPVDRIAAYIDKAGPGPVSDLGARIEDFGIPLTKSDLDSIAGFHKRFIAGGLDLRFNTHGRAPQAYYPRFRDLVTARDSSAKPASFLASEDGFRYVKRMQEENRVIPVVGNLAGDQALRGIATYARSRKLNLSAFYTSNVEQYLSRDGDLPKFAENVKAFPRDPSSLIIRSGFGYFGRQFSRGDSYSTQLFQRVDAFAAGWDSGELKSYQAILAASHAPGN